MKGKTFLKVTGILMIIFAAIGLIIDICGITGTALFSSSIDTAVGAVGVSLALTVVFIIGIIGGGLELAAGIVGVKNCNKPEKANMCLSFGITALLVETAYIFMSAISGISVSSLIISGICGLAIPILYIVGAVKNKDIRSEQKI